RLVTIVSPDSAALHPGLGLRRLSGAKSPCPVDRPYTELQRPEQYMEPGRRPRRPAAPHTRCVHKSLRCSCTNCTAIPPSPRPADATRCADPDRTSPAAKPPGRLVSRKNGGRFLGQGGESPTADPVQTNCLSSS